MSLGMGVMINMLGGNEETVKAYQESLNKTIAKAEQSGDSLMLYFNDGTGLELLDNGQSCCECRYMVIDDNLAEYAGAKFLGIELKDAPSIEYEYGDHEVQFLEVKTSKGPITAATHNEHNGYYGGFWIVARAIGPKD